MVEGNQVDVNVKNLDEVAIQLGKESETDHLILTDASSLESNNH